MQFLAFASLFSLALASPLAGRDASTSASAVDVATAFVTAYSNMDYPTLAALTTPDFTFQDAAYPNITGETARGMYRWFIHDKAKTKMIVTLHNVTASPTDPNVAIASFTDDYYFNGNHVLNNITSTMTVSNGLLALEQDSYSFSAWAEQALGPLVGPLAAPLDVTKTLIQMTAKIELDTFMLFNPE
ncbi:SnoaL-like domain-containing protein [Mycena chlorophos]|uniref:SnoaL-like domain-containing protein n=1 Tax=Mycena chlorophos TaxID=658473 RepID=A0A8H6RY26_MYCCL|nr:SnoaL-like domain-containing protein [Mycena chlorophos]